MQIRDLKSGKPNFAIVAALFGVAILLIAVAATVVVSWRAKSAQKTPFTKHPLSLVVMPGTRPAVRS